MCGPPSSRPTRRCRWPCTSTAADSSTARTRRSPRTPPVSRRQGAWWACRSTTGSAPWARSRSRSTAGGSPRPATWACKTSSPPSPGSGRTSPASAATPTTSPSSATAAGAYSTLGLLGASSADGLYRRLAGFSGAPSRLIPAWWAEELAERFVTELGVAGNPDKLIDLDAASLVAALRKVGPTDLGVRGGMDNQSLGVVLDAEQPGSVLHAHPLDVLASGSHRDIDVLLSTASDEMGWWVANDLDRFDPHAVDRVTDEFAGWRIPRSRAKKIVSTYDQGGRTPAEVRAASLTDYIFTLPAARGALAHAAVGGNAHLLMIGPAEGAPAVHGTEMYALVGQEQPGRSAEQADRDTRIRDIVLDFVTGEQTRLWPAVTDRPASGSVGNPPNEPSVHYRAVLDLFENIARP